MFDFEKPAHSRASCRALLMRFLVEPAELLAEWAPEGWERSPLFRVFHPTPEQSAEDRAAFRRNLERLFGVTTGERDDDRDELPEPAPPPEPEHEVVELLGRTLWDVFSDNHTVRDDSGVAYDLGSFRSSGGAIADAIDERYPALGDRHTYIDFYMGTAMRGHRADLTPVYAWIFARLREAGCDWTYSFPRLHLIRFDPEPASEGLLVRDPSEAVRAELAAAERAEENRAVEERMREAHDESVLRARVAPPPPVVAAYISVFGTLPDGWPPRTSAEE